MGGGAEKGVRRCDKKQNEGGLRMEPYHKVTQRIYDSVDL